MTDYLTDYEIEFWKTAHREQTIRLVKALTALREIGEIIRSNDPRLRDIVKLAEEGQK